jgi:hypothetical protein
VADTIPKQNSKRPRDIVVAQDDIYFMGKKGGLRVEVVEDESGFRYLRIRKWFDIGGRAVNSYLRINKEDHWAQIVRLVDFSFTGHLGWLGPNRESLQGEEFISVQKHRQVLKRKENEIKQRTEELRSLQTDIFQMSKNLKAARESEIKTLLPQYKKALKKFQRLLATSQKEKDMQNFLKSNHWIFGPQYISAKSEQQIGFRNRGDFLLERLDGFFDIVELKRCNANIFSGKSLSAISKNAISQMIRYLHKCDTLYTQHYTELKMDILKPEGRIIIGRSDEEVEKNLRIHNAYLNRMSIQTYDQLLITAKQMLKGFEKSD